MLIQGTVKNTFPDRGFGFIKRDDGEQDVFYHVSQLKRCGLPDELAIGQRVQFDIEDRNGKTAACDIKLLA